MRRLVLTLTAAMAVAISACDHRRFQYSPPPDEAQQLAAVERTFITGVEQGSDISTKFDVSGRLALLQLLQDVAFGEGTPRPSKDLLLTAALFLRGGEGESAFSREEMKEAGWNLLRDKLAEELNLDEGDEALIEALVGRRMSASEDELRAELDERLRARKVTGCRPAEPRYSYSADVLKQVTGPQSRRFTEWRERIQSAHLVTLDCGDTHALVLLSRYRDRDEPLITAWQFFTQDQWDVLLPKLQRTLGPEEPPK